MYNTEKYIGACLTSLLNQTFKNFEVIVVDDCSTDNSCAVVESFIPKFEGHLNLLRMKENSGGPGIPSNKGVNFSRGQYIFIMDNDDLILNTAFETLYKMAETFAADIVYMEVGYKFNGDENIMFPERENLQIMGWQGRGPFVDKPTLETENIAERIEIFCQSRIGWPVWEKFFKRDLVIQNDITFPNLKASQDIVFTIQLLCYAEKFLRIPYPLYIYRRNNANSICAVKRSDEESIKFWTDVNLQGLEFLANFLEKIKFFNENPQYKWALLDFYDGIHFNQLRRIFSNMSPQKCYDILQKIYTERFGEYGNLIAYLCNSSNFSRFKWITSMQYFSSI